MFVPVQVLAQFPIHSTIGDEDRPETINEWRWSNRVVMGVAIRHGADVIARERNQEEELLQLEHKKCCHLGGDELAERSHK